MNRGATAGSPLAARLAWGIGAGLVAVSLVGCGSSDNRASGAEAAAGDPKATEVDTIRGANYRQNSIIPFLAAEKAGVAADYGLKFEEQYIESSAAGLAALVGGEADATFSSYNGVIDAVRQGIEIRVVAENFRSVEDSMTLEVLPESGIRGLADLAGKKVGVVALNTTHDNRIKYAMLKEGLDPKTVEFVELPFGDMGSALQRGTIDAATQAGAARQAVRNTLDTRPVFDFGAGLFEEYPDGGWIMTKQFVDQNPNAVAAFQCTQIKGAELATEDDELYTSLMKDELGFDDAALKVTPKVIYPTEINTEKMQIIPDMMFELDAIDEPFDISSIVVPLPGNCA